MIQGVNVLSRKESATKDASFGYSHHIFHFDDPDSVIVGWKLTCNWDDNTGGSWSKLSKQVIGHSSAKVRITSDFWRGFDWQMTWYYVPASEYPASPWEDNHQAGFFSATELDAR